MAYTTVNGKLVRVTKNRLTGVKIKQLPNGGQTLHIDSKAVLNPRTTGRNPALSAPYGSYSDPYAPENIRPDKGHFHGACNITRCQKPNSATWWNHSTRAYYCADCAEDLNSCNRRDAMELFGHNLCTDATAVEYLWDYTAEEKLSPELAPYNLVRSPDRYNIVLKDNRARVLLRATNGEPLTDERLAELSSFLAEHATTHGGQHIGIKRLPTGRG